MLISQIQLERKKEELIQKSLKNGIIPTSYEVGSRANEFFNSRTPGLPYYRPIKQTPYGTSNKESYNQMFSNLKEDLEVAYQANIQNSHQNAELEENYLIEKDKVQSKLKTLQLRLKALDEAIHQTNSVYNHSKTFEHFYDIEFNGDLDRNLPKTNCFIDLNQKAAYLDRMSLTVDRCDLSQSTLTVKGIGDFSHIETIGDARSILKDSVNESCTYIVHSKNNQSISLNLEVELPEPLVCNSVQLRFFSQRSTQAGLTLFKDDQAEEQIYSLAHHNHFEWSFDSATIEHFVVSITKDEADGMNDQGFYEYVFTLKNLAASRESFSSKGIFVSKPITLDHAVGSVELQTEEMVFDGTDISYFVGIDNGSNRINWERVTPGIATELNIMEDITCHVPPAEMPDSKDVLPVLEPIFDVPSNCLTNTLKITPAINAWQMTCFDYGEYSDGYPEREAINLETVNIDEIQALPGMNIYQDLQPASSRVIETYSNIITILTQYVDMSNDQYVQDGEFKVFRYGSEITEQFQLRAFVNGVEVRPIENRLSFKLRKGRNKVQIMYVLDEVGEDYNEIDIQTSLDLTTVADLTYGMEPLKQIDYQTMVDQVRKNIEVASSCYTIVDDKIYVPNGLHHEVDTYEAISPYQIQYQRVKSNYKTLLTYQNGQYQMTVRLMAVLKSQNKSYSPKLMSYRLMAK